MAARRWALIVTGILAGALGVTFVVVGLDRADKIASVVGALVAVAGLGMAVRESRGAPRPAGRAGSRVRLRRSGAVRQRGAGGTQNVANTGAVLRAGTPRDVRIGRTGDIAQEGGGTANTGIWEL
jgi:hypothetical protein